MCEDRRKTESPVLVEDKSKLAKTLKNVYFSTCLGHHKALKRADVSYSFSDFPFHYIFTPRFIYHANRLQEVTINHSIPPIFRDMKSPAPLLRCSSHSFNKYLVQHCYVSETLLVWELKGTVFLPLQAHGAYILVEYFLDIK